MFRKRVHVFKAGSQTSAQGVERSFTEKDLQQVVDTYDPEVHEAPIVLGHAGDSDSMPSFGWIKGFSRQGEDLYADVDFTDVAKDLVKDGHYRKVSVSFYSPDSAINPNPGKWSARHLALLGASPPAVKGLQHLAFSEKEGVYDYATSLNPSDIFDEELGPTLIVDKGPLEMLKEKLEQVRSEMNTAVQEMQQSQDDQKQQETSNPEADTKPADEVDSPAEGEDNEEDTTQRFTESTQQIANLEDQFPEDSFMEDHSGKISRKRANGAHGQVMQIVENVYEEGDELDMEHGEMPAAFKKNAAKTKAKAKGGDEEGNPFADEHAEGEGRYETTRSDSDSYGNRMKTGKAPGGGNGSDRMKTAVSGEQDADRMNKAESGEQETDRKRTAKDGSDNATGESRWDGQPEAEARSEDMNQYDADESGYGVNKPKTASGSNPAGREDADTKMPTETEETPDNTVFAVDTENVMDDKDMRVLRKKSSDGRQAVKGGSINHSEGGKKKQLSGEFEGDDAETVGPDGAYAEVPGGEKKSTKPRLTPGEFDKVDEEAETVGPDGAYAEDNLDGEFEGGPNQKTKRSGGVFAEEHKETPNPFTKTGKGSTYEAEDADEDEDDSDYKELSSDHCGMNYGMESGGQVKPKGDAMSAMFEELKALKAENFKMKREYQESKMSARKDKLASFVEDLYESGKLTDGIMPQGELQSYCEGLEFGTIEFSEGETAATKLLGLLNRLPSMVEYGEVAAGGVFQYSEEDLDPHQKALRLVESEGLEYTEALKKALYS